ncbi:unnamed protein product [Rotaria sp. Silwood2]|nr:unnamed protein product [Rotaria sp. Silwood2]
MFPELPVYGLPLNSTPSEAFVIFLAYGINVDLNIDSKKYPRLIKRHLSQKDCGSSIYYFNWNVDILFDVLHRWHYPLPIATCHPDDPINYEHF